MHRMDAQLPETFRPILWFYDFERLDPVRRQHFNFFPFLFGGGR
jgi:hypothetical protein